jgi:hypothetical protein
VFDDDGHAFSFGVGIVHAAARSYRFANHACTTLRARPC